MGCNPLKGTETLLDIKFTKFRFLNVLLYIWRNHKTLFYASEKCKINSWNLKLFNLKRVQKTGQHLETFVSLLLAVSEARVWEKRFFVQLGGFFSLSFRLLYFYFLSHFEMIVFVPALFSCAAFSPVAPLPGIIGTGVTSTSDGGWKVRFDVFSWFFLLFERECFVLHGVCFFVVESDRDVKVILMWKWFRHYNAKKKNEK